MNKNALLFILNRVTGKPIFPCRGTARAAERCAGREDLAHPAFPGEARAAWRSTRVSRDNLYKGEPEHQAYCENLVDDNHMELGGPYLPPGYNEITVAPPGTQGGVNYYGGSFDPKLHLFVANVNNLFQPMRVVKTAGRHLRQ